MPSFRMVMEAIVDAFERKREDLRDRAPEIRARLGAIGEIEPSPDLPGEAELDAAVAQLRLERRPTTRRLPRSAEVPAGLGPRPAAYPRRDRGRREDPRRDARRRHLRPGRRWLRPLLGRRRSGWSPTSRRCSTTTPCWRAPTCTAGRPSATSATAASASRRWTGCWPRCAVPRVASTPPSTPTRRARRGASTSGPRREIRELLGDGAEAVIDYYGVSERGNFEGANILHLAAGAEAEPPPGLRGRPPDPLRGARQAGLARARRQAADRLERAGDLGPGRGRRRPRPRRLPRRRPRAAPSSCSAPCATAMASCCAPTRTATPASTPTSRTTPSCSKRC